jgi:sulfur-oxidizing protein SoxY
MNQTRRNILRGTVSGGVLAVAVGAGLLRAGSTSAAIVDTNLLHVLRQLQASKPTLSDAVKMKAPSIAVDGASFFIEFSTDLPDVDTLIVLVDENPQPLIAAFQITPEVEPAIVTRIKLFKTGNVRVVVRSAGQFFMTERMVKVTVGGCGAGLN